ncbi:alkaline phosphatase D [Robiginitalea myxolifaciens]|uniref:Alkaline phosphatase D n=1 Tax=Robiginitalea myxolifaciens TaxID=400055 RepID=A0A1I6FNA2_9FLAO|nr:alkaline phosphatase D family protein [Robiginitalea myxolifaciens]SFR31443.1 alkaline phosphatase D [Robiginitalea myxolifaciens]
MYRYLIGVSLVFLMLSCKSNKPATGDEKREEAAEFRIAFGSCNRTDLPNLLWDDILDQDPDLWIWGGDNIYADTDDMEKMAALYALMKADTAYARLRQNMPIIGTWDDHDYGLNDGGVEFAAKAESQQVFLDFMDVPAASPRRQREGVYATHEFEVGRQSVKVLVLDTRYFRSPLQPDPTGKKRYIPKLRDGGTVLGEAQWNWLTRELEASQADFNIIVSSIQVLSSEHGFETWGLFPAEQSRLLETIVNSRAKGVIMLTGDRHISEISQIEYKAAAYPLIDFTSSGLTHAYRNFSGEPNRYRVGEVVAIESFGMVLLDLDSRKATLQIRGDKGQVLREMVQQY